MPVAVLYFRGLVEHQLVNAAIVPLFAVVALAVMSAIQVRSQSPAWTVPEVGALPRDARGLQVREGRDLITATYAYIGPDVPDVSKRYAGNNLACTNCHLQAGTKKFGIPLFGLYGDFPKYSARTGGEISIEERIDSCMTRSMNGRVLPNDTPEMLAIVLYIKFLSSGVAPNRSCPGSAPVTCRNSRAPPILSSANRFLPTPARLATIPTDRACAEALPAPISDI
jgi:cytochrome c